MIRLRQYLVLGTAMLLVGCDFREFADQTFGDQHFKTAISLIELHKVRYGVYPESLKALRYTGEWDQIALQSVEYEKQNRGYRLIVARGWVGAPDLNYPDDFWQGLGLINREDYQEQDDAPAQDAMGI